MTHRVIVLGNGRAVSLGSYATAWRTAKGSAAGTVFSHGCTGWWSVTREEVLREFLAGLHDRINRHAPNHGAAWRKLDSDWQRATGHAARALNTPRLAIRESQLPLWLRSRMAHRITEE